MLRTGASRALRVLRASLYLRRRLEPVGPVVEPLAVEAVAAAADGLQLRDGGLHRVPVPFRGGGFDRAARGLRVLGPLDRVGARLRPSRTPRPRRTASRARRPAPAVSGPLVAVADWRSAVKPGPTCFITLLSASSSGDIGGGRRLARSVIAPLITEVAMIAGAAAILRGDVGREDRHRVLHPRGGVGGVEPHDFADHRDVGVRLDRRVQERREDQHVLRRLFARSWSTENAAPP